MYTQIVQDHIRHAHAWFYFPRTAALQIAGEIGGTHIESVVLRGLE